ncbi:MAG: alpha amylase C-terminal domain-containing protein, partial [Arenimonas sp.]|nr:alpha amylase C-terminal domain-containing protein [Arenimonas sp.]
HALPWELCGRPLHAGVQQLVRDLNRIYREQPALHRLDCEAAGFQWLVADDAENSTFAWRRRDGRGGDAIVVCNFTPVPRIAYRVGLPEDAASQWREALNTDSRHYGGSDLGNGAGALVAEAVAAQGHPRSLSLTLPPLSTLMLVPL